MTMMPQMGDKIEAAGRARRLLRAQHFGALATVSHRLEGYPFGSVVDYCLDATGQPVMLISTIAQHTQNIDHDPKVSLLVHESCANVQANARLTLVGDAGRIDMSPALKQRYLRHFPEAEQYFAIHDFFFYRIEVKAVRFIGGFGDIYWLEPEAVLPNDQALADSEEGILAHMNRDHADSLLAYCRHFYGKDGGAAEMVGVDSDGFDLRWDGELLRFDFDQPVGGPEDVRRELTALARRCREAA